MASQLSSVALASASQPALALSFRGAGGATRGAGCRGGRGRVVLSRASRHRSRGSRSGAAAHQ